MPKAQADGSADDGRGGHGPPQDIPKLEARVKESACDAEWKRLAMTRRPFQGLKTGEDDELMDKARKALTVGKLRTNTNGTDGRDTPHGNTAEEHGKTHNAQYAGTRRTIGT